MARQILALLNAGEGKTLEFKRDLSSPRNVLKTLVAFANSAGGHLLIGVSDSLELIGLESPLDDERRLRSLITESIMPRLAPKMDILTINGKHILMVETLPSDSRPHCLYKGDNERDTYVRIGSSNLPADPGIIEELRRSVTGIAFDEQPMSDLGKDDLDLDAAQKAFRNGRLLTDGALLKMGLLRQQKDRLAPTVGAVLLFGKNRREHFPDAWVRCSRFTGTDKANIFDQIDIHSHLPDWVHLTLDFLKKHATRASGAFDDQVNHLRSIPLQMLRETVVNAVVHADYSHRGTPIRVAFFDNRVEVESPGIIVPGMTIEALKAGSCKLRNRVIPRVFRELGLIEQQHCDVSRIFTEAQKLKLPEPIIEEVGMHLRITVFLAGTRNSE